MRNTSPITYLTREDVESLAHWLASELFREYDSPMPAFTLMGEQGSALLDSALALPRQSAFGKDAYPSVFDKAAVLFRSLTKNHALVDGNKRLATAATLVFLGLNGWFLTVAPSELVDKALRMASPRGLSWKSVSRWLKAHSVSWRDARLEQAFSLHLEKQYRSAIDEGALSESDLARLVEFLRRQPTDISLADVPRFLQTLKSEIAEDRVLQSFFVMLGRSFETAIKDLAVK